MFNSKMLMIYGGILIGLSPLYHEFNQVSGMEKKQPEKKTARDFQTALPLDIKEHYVDIYRDMQKLDPKCFKIWVDSVKETQGGKYLLKEVYNEVARKYAVTEKDNSLINLKYLEKIIK